MNRMIAVFNIYWEHALVRVCVLTVALTMGMVKIAAAFSARVSVWLVEDLLLVWYLALLTLAFMLGIIIKRQITSHQRQLLPGYRSVHILVALGLWVIIALAVACWLESLPLMRGLSLQKAPLAALAVLTFLTTVIVAYCSVRYLFIFIYVSALFAFAHVMDLHDLIVRFPLGYPLLLGLIALFTIMFVGRLWMLREGCFEFGYLFAWPLHRCQEGDSLATSKGIYVEHHMEPYHLTDGLWKKALHWRSVEIDDIKGFGMFILSAVGAFECYVYNSSGTDGFYTKPYENFLLFVMVPFFMSLCFNYRVLAYSGYAHILPVKKEDVILQWGVLLLYSLTVSWFFCVAVFAIVPGFILHLAFVYAPRFWAYVLFCGTFAQVTLWWFIYVAAVEQKPAIAHCLGYLTLVLVLFLKVGSMSASVLVLLLITALMAGMFFSFKAYLQWCGKEVES